MKKKIENIVKSLRYENYECDFIIYSAQLFRCTEINRRKEDKSDADAVIEGHSGASRSVCAYQTRRLIVFASNVNRAIT